MKLSFAIPTHHGRCEVLRGALDVLLTQAREVDFDIEICINDNASLDGTREMVRELAATNPDVPIVYRRNPIDRRLENIFMAVELASGDWVWLHSSDDRLVDGALARVGAALRADPDVSGLCTGRVNLVDNYSTRAPGDGAGFAHPARETTRLEGFGDILEGMLFPMTFLSTVVVRRARWEAAAALGRDRALGHRDFPQVVIEALMMQANPAWTWLPDVLVKARAETVYLIEDQVNGADLAELHALLIAGLHGAVIDVVGRGTPLARRMQRRLHSVLGDPGRTIQAKTQGRPTLRGEALLLAAQLRVFWRIPAFWRWSLPLLLTPAFLVRARRRRARGAAMTELTTAQISTRVEVAVPSRLWRREMASVHADVTNHSSVELRSSGAHAVVMSYRWERADRTLVLEGNRFELRRPLAPGARARVAVELLTPWDAGEYMLHLGLVQEGVTWFDGVDPANSWRGVVHVAAVEG
jgi:hypothetical protein